MRSALAAMYRAGIRAAQFRALYGGRTAKGHVALNDVETPSGAMLDHVWIRDGNWHGPAYRHGQPIEILASLEPYWKEDGSQDIGLYNVRVVG